MAFLGIQIPTYIGKQLSKIDVPGDKTNVDELHITLFYFGKNMPLSEISKSLNVIHEVIAKTPTFTVKMSLVSSFPRSEGDKGAIIAKVESPELHKFRTKLAKNLDDNKIEYSKDFKDYKPHVTLSYAKEIPKDFKFNPLECIIDEIILWAGEEMNDKLIVCFPLSDKKAEKHAILRAKVGIFEKLAGQLL